MACTLAYPCPLVEAHVNRIDSLKRLTPWSNVGYSDHTRGIAAADYAFRAGAMMVEKHVTLTPGAGGDHDFGITPVDVNHLVVGDVWTDDVVDALVAGDEKLFVRGVEQKARRLARRSPHALVDIPAGETIDYTNTIMLRPADGIDPFALPITAEVDVRAGQVIHH
jgi:sialic acid synthase SpsE